MTDKPEVMTGESLDIAVQRRNELKQLFPGVFTETKDAEGNLVSSIDFERLKAELGTFSDIYEGRRERYGMEWPGKRDCMKVIQEPSRATLKPCPDESVGWDTTKNLFIEGDNLEVLKLLQKSYYGKVKMIYIDPPYNTGNEFIYPDNYQETLDTYLAYAGLLDDEGKKFTTNTASEGRYHTKWLNMMFPRLFLARNLLNDEGVILLSIDDSEVDNAKRLLNEVFGEENFIASLIWEKGRKNDAKLFSVGHEYILVYAKQLQNLRDNGVVWREEKPGAKEIWDEYTKLRKAFVEDELVESHLQNWFSELPSSHPSKKWSRYKRVDKYGPWRDRDISWPGGDGPKYDIIHPITGKPCAIPEAGWRYSDPNEMNRQIRLGLVEFREDHTKPPFRKAHIKPVNVDTINIEDDQDDNEDDGELATQVRGTYFYKQSQVSVKYLRSLMGGKVFNNPKDHVELKKLIHYICQPKDGDIVLDFFAGSGSTGHAVMELAAEQSVSMNFILIQLPEPINLKDKVGKAAAKAGFNKISDITKERLRKAANEIFNLDAEKAKQVDLGFRVFSLDKSSFKEWQAKANGALKEIQTQLDLSVNNIVDGKSQEDILFEILLKAGFEPSELVESINLNGKIVFSVANRALLICLEDQLTAELIDAVIALEPMQFICLDKGFQGNDQLKANTAQAFKARSQDSEAEMIFKVV